MTEQQLEQLDAVAHAYRSWPGADPSGVAACFAELVKHVEGLIEEAKGDEADSWRSWFNEHGDR